MSSITSEIFDRAVAKYFEPIAQEYNWQMIRRTEKLYEMPSPSFVLRVRFHVGAHAKSINATLIPTIEMPGDVENGGEGELGIAVVAGYNGVPIGYIPWENTEEGLFAEAQHRANMVRQYGLPYLLSQKSDWDNVRNYIQTKINKRAEEIKEMKFPSFVQKRWHLPPLEESGEEPQS